MRPEIPPFSLVLAPAAVIAGLAFTMVAPSAAPFGGDVAIAAAPGAHSGLPARARSGFQPVAVFGTDDRVPLPDHRKELDKSIGLIYEPRSKSACTAFCVGDDIAATAGHCLFRTSGERPPRLGSFSFRIQPSGQKERSTRIAGAEIHAAPQNVAAGTLSLRVRPPIDAASDWALVRLSKPICKGHALPLSPHPASELVALSTEQRVYQVSYHRDFGNWELALGHPCPIRRSFGGADWRSISKDFTDARHVILHTCDTGEASSGSPLLIDGAQGPEVIGINVGTYMQSRVLRQQGHVVHRYKSQTVANTAVSTDVFRTALDAFERAEILATRDDIRALQRLLSAEGYPVGAVDGLYGPKLSAAIRAFERAEGRAETGLATTDLLRRLAARDAERRGGGAKRPPRRPSIETGSLHSHGADKDRLRRLAR